MTEHRPDDDHPLDRLARSSVPPLDPVRRDRIESGLRVRHAEKQGARAVGGGRRWLIAAPALLVLLVIATVALVARDTDPVAALEVRDARDVVVTLPDGSTVRDPADGFELRDGAVITVEIGGSITIDDVVFDGGTTVTIRDGRFVTDVRATTTTGRPDDRDSDAPAIDEPRPADPTTTTTTTTTRPADRPSATTTTTITTTTAPLDRPPDDTRASLPPSDDQDRPPPAEGGHGDADGDGVDVAVALRLRARDGAVRVSWSTEGIGDQPWHVVVVRTTDGSIPVAAGDGTTVATGRHGELVEHRADFGDRVVEIVYRVLVLDEGDGVVAQSAPQTLRPPDS